MSLDLPPTVQEVVELLDLIPHPEGGFFREIYRSGSVPMSSRGQTDFDVAPEHLVTTSGREGHRDDPRRNALTSIYWMPTRNHPNLLLVHNESAHTHNYHGGLPFEYVLYDPKTHGITKAILGPNLRAGHRPQVIVEGKVWKTGRLMTEYSDKYDYCLLGESVAPGFDVSDLKSMDSKIFSQLPIEVQHELRPYYNLSEGTDLEFDSHYDDDVKRKERANIRL